MKNKIKKITCIIYILFILIFGYFIIMDTLNHKFINVIVDIVFFIVDIFYLNKHLNKNI